MKRILILLILYTTFTQAQQEITKKHFRHLQYNHVSPHIPIIGIYEINQKQAKQASHYIFTYNTSGRLIEIINNHYHNVRNHPLHTLGAYKTVFSYTDTTETRIYFDKKNERMKNEREVYKEVFAYDTKGFKKSLHFYDLDDNPMESNWNVAYYQWSKHKELVIEHRYNLKDEAVNISPYFEFGITGILYNKDDTPKVNYNLNTALKTTENSFGIASYQDTYDTNGNHIQYSYHDKNGQFTNNQWGFAIGKKGYDIFGNHINKSAYDKNQKLIDSREEPSNINIKIATSATQKDSVAIRTKSLAYLRALQELDSTLMKSAFHPDLAKRTLGYDRKEKKEIIRETTYEQMIEFSKSWNKVGNKFPPNPNNQAIILDIYNRIATVKLISDNWVEYLQLVQTNNEWKIINLLWQHKDTSRYPDIKS
ncbi:nuclear transport factor 2 family protein [Aquimarina sp. MMG016]|uniref:nuclear transport factor 2 family protein n=1 Tax=Aquimarina sp. MMG016 TaxID=2822690 RepID=UPI001B3A6EB9|nr:nuclear transport factor 2 family protein [Aquimarina sp. MMG016]MBQ4819581.1 nuclear transport factor 2 family protein [Aquimarina sp. MMG016]